AQTSPSVAMDASGDFVVTWQSNVRDGSGYGIYAQRYDAAGVAQGGEFAVSSYITGAQTTPSVAMDANGDFVVAWQSSGQDGLGYGIYAQAYHATGASNGVEFRVNSYTTSDQYAVQIATSGAGEFVAAWQSLSGVGMVRPFDVVWSQKR